MAYGREGKKCVFCSSTMLKDKLHGRGTTYCPKCQNVCISIGITGKIASGKSTLLTYIKEKGYKIFSCDDEVKNLYKQDKIITRLKEIFGNKIEVYAFVGPSGTGKSYRAQMVASEKNIKFIKTTTKSIIYENF